MVRILRSLRSLRSGSHGQVFGERIILAGLASFAPTITSSHLFPLPSPDTHRPFGLIWVRPSWLDHLKKAVFYGGVVETAGCTGCREGTTGAQVAAQELPGLSSRASKWSPPLLLPNPMALPGPNHTLAMRASRQSNTILAHVPLCPYLHRTLFNMG